jgi:hypothetical protein
MGAIPIFVEQFHSQHPELMQREIGRCLAAGHQAMGEVWLDELLEEHFTPAAKTIFQHLPRTIKHVRRKVRMAQVGKVEDGGLVDNVFTGLSRRSMLRAQASRPVRATSGRTTIQLQVPWYFTLRRAKGPNKAREVKTISDRHARVLAAASGKAYSRKLKTIQARKTVKTA